MIELKTLDKTFQMIHASDHITATIPDGMAFGLIGSNGAGKSTAIKCIAGLLRYQGIVMINGFPNKSLEAKRMFGYVPELPAPYELLTVSEHLEFIARAYRVDQWQEKATRLMERFELTDKADKLGKELSKGMQQKLSLCCALLPSPRVLMLDEPLVGLDPHAIKELKDVLQELRAQGVSILISTHMLDSVRDFWDKVLIMMQGRIVRVCTRQEIEQSGEDLEQVFFDVTEQQGQVTDA